MNSCTVGGVVIALGWPLALAALAALIAVVTLVPTIRATATGAIWSSPISWTGWGALGVVATAGQAELGTTAAVAVVGVLTVCTLGVAVAAVVALRRGTAPERAEPDWQYLVDTVCILGAGAAFVALLFATAATAIALTVAVDLIAAVPTAAAAWRDPFVSPLWTFFGLAMASATGILAGGTPARFVDVAYLLWVFVLDAALVFVVLGRRWWSDRTALAVLDLGLPVRRGASGSSGQPVPWRW